jgi:peptidoglycan glycosyltransferase
VVTSAAGLTQGTVTETEPEYPSVRQYTPPLTTRPISNFGQSVCGGTLFTVLAKSCNTAFAEMAAEQVGAEGMIDTSEAVGFNDRPPIDLPDPAESLYPTDFGEVVSEPEGKAPVVEDSPALAQTGIGQNDVAATPLQMALVAAAVANGGEIMTPHVMSEVRARSGDVVDRFDEGVWRTAFNPNVAETLKEAMVGVVSDGTAAVMDIPGAEVGAKTGTAQLGTDPPRSHAWMIAFAGPPGEAPTVAVAVVVNDLDGGSGQTGGQVAGPIARAVVETALAVQ